MKNNIKLQGRIEEEQLKDILKALSGVNNSQWNLIKGSVDQYFKSKAAKLELDDSEDLNNYSTNCLKL